MVTDSSGERFLSHKTYRFFNLYPHQFFRGSWSEDKFFMLLLFRKLQWWEGNDKYPEIILCGWDKIANCFETLVIQLRKDLHSGIHRPADDIINSSWRLTLNRKDQPHTIIRWVLYRYILYRLVNIFNSQHIIFLFVCFLGVVVVACYILRTNVKEISILMSVNKLKNLNLDQYRF